MCMDAYTEGFRGSLEFHTCEGEKEAELGRGRN